MGDRYIGIDIGYGRVKVYNDDICGNFPSAVSSYTEETTFVGRTSVHPFVIRGIPYLAGEEAIIHSSSLLDTRTDGYVGSPGWCALLANALFLADYHPEQPGAVMVIGIPPGHASFDRYDSIEAAIRLLRVDMQHSCRSFAFSDTRVVVVPQAVGIYYCYAGVVPEAWEQDVAVVDLGHQTLDMIFMSKGAYVERFKFTHEPGISRELERIRQSARAMTVPLRFGYRDLADWIGDKSLFDVGSSHHVPGAEGILKTYTVNIISMVEAFLRSLPRQPDACLIGGGGARFLDGELMKSTELFLAPEPDMANAIGFRRYAQWEDEVKNA